MKRIVLAVIIGVASLNSINTKAQVSLHLNIGQQPKWAPVGHQQAAYYYLPEIESYYHVANKQYIYLNNGRWITSKNLPSRYRNYDLYRGHKVAMNSPKPYLLHANNVKQYNKFKGNNNGKQVVMRDRDDRRDYDRGGRDRKIAANKRDSRNDGDNRDHQRFNRG